MTATEAVLAFALVTGYVSLGGIVATYALVVTVDGGLDLDHAPALFAVAGIAWPAVVAVAIAGLVARHASAAIRHAARATR